MTPDQQKAFMHLGATLLAIQAAERTIRFCLQCCLPGGAAISIETLNGTDNALKKKTLGQFLTLLRTRVDLDDNFDAVLTDFLEQRNLLIHHADDIPGWDIAMHDGCKTALKFIDNAFTTCQKITFVFAALARKWAEQNAITVDLPAHPFFAELDAIYKPMVDDLFFKKD